jgi:hypothetical protein
MTMRRLLTDAPPIRKGRVGAGRASRVLKNLAAPGNSSWWLKLAFGKIRAPLTVGGIFLIECAAESDVNGQQIFIRISTPITICRVNASMDFEILNDDPQKPSQEFKDFYSRVFRNAADEMHFPFEDLEHVLVADQANYGAAISRLGGDLTPETMPPQWHTVNP